MKHVAYEFYNSPVFTLSSSILLGVVGGSQLLADKVLFVKFGNIFVNEFTAPVRLDHFYCITSVTQNLANNLLDTGENVRFLGDAESKSITSGIILNEEAV